MTQILFSGSNVKLDRALVVEIASAWRAHNVPCDTLFTVDSFPTKLAASVLDAAKVLSKAHFNPRLLMVAGLQTGLHFHGLARHARDILAKAVRAHRPSVVEVYDSFAGCAARSLGVPYIVSLRPANSWEGFGAAVISDYFFECESKTIAGAAKVIVQCESDAALLAERHSVPLDRFAVLPRWVDGDVFTPLVDPSLSRLPHFVMLHDPRHGQIGVVCALKALAEVKAPNVDLWVAGVPRGRALIARTVRELDLVPNVRLREFISRDDLIPALQRASGVIWSLGASEFGDSGHLVSVPEVMSLKVPVVASCSDMWDPPVKKRHNGLTFQAEDHRELASILRDLLNRESESISTMVETAAREAASIYSFDNWARKRLDILEATGEFSGLDIFRR